MRETSETEASIAIPLPAHTRQKRLEAAVVLHPRTSTADSKRSRASANTEHTQASSSNNTRSRASSATTPFHHRPYSCISAASGSTPDTSYSSHSPYSSRSNTPDKGKTPIPAGGKNGVKIVLSPATPPPASSSSSGGGSTSTTSPTTPEQPPPPPKQQPLRTSLDVRTDLAQRDLTTPADVHALTLLPPYHYNLRLEILKAQQKRRDNGRLSYTAGPAADDDEKERSPKSYGNKYLAALQQRQRRLSDSSGGVWLEEGRGEKGSRAGSGGLVCNDSVGVWRPSTGRSCFTRVLMLIGVVFVVVVVLAVVVTQVVEKKKDG